MEHVTPLRAWPGLDDARTTSQISISSAESMTGNSRRRPEGSEPDDIPPRTHLSTPKHNFELLASRTVSQAMSEEARASKLHASPLDSINPILYPRFPRFSITTESSHPDFSTDEVISTKISLDEEGIVATRRSFHTSNARPSKRQRLHLTLHRAMSSPTLGLRRIGYRMKLAPSILFSNRTSKPPPGSICQIQAEV